MSAAKWAGAHRARVAFIESQVLLGVSRDEAVQSQHEALLAALKGSGSMTPEDATAIGTEWKTGPWIDSQLRERQGDQRRDDRRRASSAENSLCARHSGAICKYVNDHIFTYVQSCSPNNEISIFRFV